MIRPYSEVLASFVVVLVGSLVVADEARDIVERGMKARCEKVELLEKQRCQVISMIGKIILPDQTETDATGEINVEWPTSLRWERNMVLPKGQGKVQTIMAFQIDRAWKQASTTPPTDLNLVDTEEFKMEIYGRWLATLYPLKDKAFSFTLLKDAKVNDEDVAVIKVALRFRPDVYLSFSKKTGQLVKVAYRAREGGIDLRKEHILSDYREFDGIKLPTKMVDMMQVGTQPAVKAAEWTVTNYKFVEKFGSDLFDKPDEKKK